MIRDIKIFVDADEEVTFIVEKIENAPSARVCIVVPDGAALLRSMVGLKLLRKNLVRSEKVGVVVTMDQEAKRLCELIGLKCVERVGEVTEEVWEEAAKMVKEDWDKLKPVEKSGSVEEKQEEAPKETLFDRVGELEPEKKVERPVAEDLPDVEVLEQEETEKTEAREHHTEDLSIEFESGKELEPLDEAVVEEDAKPQQSRDEVKKTAASAGFVAGAKSFLSKAFSKSKGVVFGAASGVKAKFAEARQRQTKVHGPAKDLPDNEEADSFVVPGSRNRSTSGVDLMRYQRGTSRRVVRSSWTPATIRRAPSGGGSYSRSSRVARGGGLSFLRNIRLPFKLPKGKLTYYVAGGFALVLVLFCLYLYLIAPSAKIILYVDAQTIAENVTVTGDTETMAVDSLNLKIPLTEHATTEEGADSAMTTGSGVIGDYATGNVSVINNTVNPITVSDGATITCISSACNGLKFTATSAITIPAVDVDTVPVQASEYGANYNLSPNQSFKLGSYDPTTEVVIKNLASFTGGTSQDVTTVSKKDRTDLSESLKGSLTEACSTKLRTELGEGTVVIEKSLKSEVTEETFDKNEGDQADVLNLSMTISCSALIYRRSDITQLAQTIAEAKVTEGYSLDQSSFSPTETVVSTTKTTASFELAISGKGIPILDTIALKRELKGMSLGKATERLDAITNIADYSLTYSPNWAPGFLKHIPNNENLINLETQPVTH